MELPSDPGERQPPDFIALDKTTHGTIGSMGVLPREYTQRSPVAYRADWRQPDCRIEQELVKGDGAGRNALQALRPRIFCEEIRPAQKYPNKCSQKC
jgi:hypothetical protein